MSGLGLRSTAFLGTTSAAVPSAPSISITYNFSEPGYDEEGNANGTTLYFYTLNISHGSNNGSAVTSTQIQISSDNVNWYNYNDPLYPPNNNIYQYITLLSTDYFRYWRVYDTNGIGNGALSNVVTST